MLSTLLCVVISAVSAIEQSQHLFVLDANAKRGSAPFQLREVDTTTGDIVSVVPVALPNRGSPGYVITNNNYDLAVDPDPLHGAFYIMLRYGTAIPHEEKTNYSLPMLLRIDRNTGSVTEVASIPKANLRGAFDSPGDHITFDKSSGKVVVLSRNYQEPYTLTSNLSYVFSSIDVKTGVVEDLGTMPMGECVECAHDKGESVISERGDYAADLGLFCDVSRRIFDGAPRFNGYDTCWDVRTGAVKRNTSDFVQFTSMRYDSTSKRMVGLGQCCDPTVPGSSPACPKQCIGRAYNRTWVSWDVKSEGATPQLVRILDPLPSEERGSTWLPLGAAVDEESRTFSYVSITAAEGSKITGLQFVHLDIDSGDVRGRTTYNVTGSSRWGWNGNIYRYGYAASSKQSHSAKMLV